MSISALGTLSSQSTEVGSSSAARNAASLIEARREQPYRRNTVSGRRDHRRQPRADVRDLAEGERAQPDRGVVAGRLGEERFAVEDGVEPVPVQATRADDRPQRFRAVQRPGASP